MDNKNSSSNRFTLVELLAVISVILILLALFLPMLGGAMSQVRGVFCANNLRSLTIAWTTYSSDSDGYLANATSFAPGTYYPTPWACNVPYNPSVNASRAQRQAAISQGSLWPYINNYDAYHCPDHPFNRTPKELVRTYSVNNFLGGGEETGGFPVVIGYWAYSNEPAKGHINKMGSIYNPVKTYVFIEEDDDRGDLVGAFSVSVSSSSWVWVDAPGRWHSISKYDKGGTMFSFADGHTEYWKWQDYRTRTLITSHPETNMTAPQPNNPDLLRLQKAVCPGNPYTPWLNN